MILRWHLALLLSVGFHSFGAIFFLPQRGFAQSREVSFTLDDRDRIIQTQVEVASLRNEMNTRFESQQKQIDFKFDSLQQQINDLKTLFYWGFGIMMSLMLFLLGFIIWDRRTVTEPLRERTTSLIQTLREYAKEQPNLADILRSHGLM